MFDVPVQERKMQALGDRFVNGDGNFVCMKPFFFARCIPLDTKTREV